MPQILLKHISTHHPHPPHTHSSSAHLWAGRVAQHERSAARARPETKKGAKVKEHTWRCMNHCNMHRKRPKLGAKQQAAAAQHTPEVGAQEPSRVHNCTRVRVRGRGGGLNAGCNGRRIAVCHSQEETSLQDMP